MKWLKVFLLVGVAMVLSAGRLQAAVTTGEAAPNFTLTDTQGKSHSLVDFKGKFVVLEWFNHECPFVKKQYESHNMQSLQKTYTDKGVIWLSINSSSLNKEGYNTPEQTNQLTKEKEASPTAVLLDSDGKVGKLYGAQTTPHMFIINPDGLVIYQGAIDSIPSADPSDLVKAKNYVQLTLDAALEGKPVLVGSTKSYGCSVKY